MPEANALTLRRTPDAPQTHPVESAHPDHSLHPPEGGKLCDAARSRLLITQQNFKPVGTLTGLILSAVLKQKAVHVPLRITT